MAEPAELTPIELDRLEDALEDLELAPATDEPSAAVRGRLHDYRQILTLSRAALPMLDVPRGLLDGVLAEARAAAELQVVAPIESTPPERASWWARLRRAALLPGVALATTAALVLIMFEQKDEAPPSTMSSPVVARGEPELASDKSRRASTPTVDARASEAKREEAPAAEPAAPAAGLAAPPPISAAPGSTPLEQQQDADQLGNLEKREQAEKKKLKPDDAAPKSATTAVDQETTPRWDIIARGDRARHKMDCNAARSEYKLALGDLDARVRARAHAGLGLCEAAKGDRPAADAAYEQARALDAEIAGFIEAERPRGAGAKPANASKKSKVKAAAPPLMDDAFESDQAEQQQRKE